MTSGLRRSGLLAVLLVALAVVAACAPSTSEPMESEAAGQVVTIEELHSVLETKEDRKSVV